MENPDDIEATAIGLLASSKRTPANAYFTRYRSSTRSSIVTPSPGSVGTGIVPPVTSIQSPSGLA